MADITYYTKLGCLTSTKQIDLLRQSGHEVEIQTCSQPASLPATQPVCP